MCIYNAFLKISKFKVGDIIVLESSESWDERRKEYKILSVGDHNYKVEMVHKVYSGIDDLYGRLSFERENDYKVKK
jgi:hypothetical protein